MACHAIQPWTFCGLVGAFLDLALAYFLLCGATVAFFASKFLGVFGLYLPCPCNGLFGDPNGGICLQRLLVNRPSGKVSSVQMSVKTKFPFDSNWMKDEEDNLNVKFVGETEHNEGLPEIEAEASCSFFPDVQRSQNLTVSDLKGKGTLNQKSRSGLRHRRREHVKFSSVSSCDPSQSIVPDFSHSPYDISEVGTGISEESSNHVDSRKAKLQNNGGFEADGTFDEDKALEKVSSSIEVVVPNARSEQGIDRNVDNAIRVLDLEEALEEQHAACDALYLELDKERSAAATAADEAMAMILRLQKEKALIEMEAMQYQRMVEEKYAYDAEEMDILKEILVRREREKHFLEKEVEAYRQTMLLGNEQLEDDGHDIGDTSGQTPTSPFDLSEDPELMLQWISNSIDKKKMVNKTTEFSDYAVPIFKKQSSSHYEDPDFSKLVDIQRELSIVEHHQDVPRQGNWHNQEFQEKGIISVDENLSAPLEEDQRSEGDSGSEGHQLFEKTIILMNEEVGLGNNGKPCQEMALKNKETLNETEIHFQYNDVNLEKHGKDAEGGTDKHNSIFEEEPSVHDVHIIDDKSKLFNDGSGKESKKLLTDAASEGSRICGLPLEASRVRRIKFFSTRSSMSKVEIEPDIHRSSSDMTSGLPPTGKSQRKPMLFDLRRNSMSALDNERSKLDNEVGWLRDRLRIVQEGREKLNFSMEHREREKIQLQLLEDIASQLQEIRQLTESGKARQSSLPPSSSKVISKKRCRSSSCGVHESI